MPDDSRFRTLFYAGRGIKMRRKSRREETVDGVQASIFGSTQAIARRFVCVCIALSLIGWAASFAADDQLFELKEVTDGVYIALAKRAHVLNSNAAVIVLDDGVLVVDTHSKPSAGASAHQADQDDNRQTGPLCGRYPFSLRPLPRQRRLQGGLSRGAGYRLGAYPPRYCPSRHPAHQGGTRRGRRIWQVRPTY